MEGEVPTPDYRQIFGEEAWDSACNLVNGLLRSSSRVDADLLPEPGEFVFEILGSFLASGVLHIEYRVRANRTSPRHPGRAYEAIKEQRLVSEWQPTLTPRLDDRLRCALRGSLARFRRIRWDGHCWGSDGCIDCGKPYPKELS